MTIPADRQPAPDAGLERSVATGGGGRGVIRGVTWTMSGETLAYAAQLVTTMVLARLLTPEIFGVMAMALTLTVIVDQFRTLGLSQAVVQRDHLTWVQVNALFWINAAVGAVLAFVVAGTGPLLAIFYGEPDLAWICLALGVGYLVSGVSVQHNALLNRGLRFRTLAVRNVIARVLSCVVAIVVALAGGGVWALIAQQVAAVVFSGVVVWTAVHWRPSRPGGFRAVRPLIAFGGLITAANVFNVVARQADNIVIGKMAGPAELGLYTRAYSLLTLPLRQIKNPIAAVMVPTLSALQEEPDRFRRAYLQSVNGLAHVGMPLVVVLAAGAHEVIEVFLGQQWLGAVPIFQLLAVASFAQLVTTTTGWLFVSTGRGAAAARWAGVSSALTVASFVVGVRWGAMGVAAAYAIGQVVLAVPAFVVACRNTPVPTYGPFFAVARPLVVSAFAFGAAFTARLAVADAGPAIVTLAVMSAAALVGWGLVMAVWPSARKDVVTVIAMARRREDAP